MSISQLTTAQLKKAVVIREQLEKLEAQLDSLLGSSAAAPKSTAKASPAGRKAGKRTMSSEARAKIAAAQAARWARVRGTSVPKSPSRPAKAAKSGKRTMSPEARAKIAAAQAARWARVRGTAPKAAAKPVKAAKAGKRTMSPEARAKIAEAQRRRWARAKA